MEHETNEWLRKTLHIAFGFCAIALHWLPWKTAACVALIAVVFNWFLLHRIFGREVSRHERGFDSGIVLYPVMVLLLIITFRQQPLNAAVCWALLGIGDGFAGVAGKLLPIRRLPWNSQKSFGGLFGFLIAGTAAVFLVSRLFGAPMTAPMIAAVVVSALAESLDLGMNDNISVPLFAATVLIVFSPTALHPPGFPAVAWEWVIGNTVLALAGYLMRGVDGGGALGGWLLGTIIILSGGPALYVALIAFFLIGTIVTKIGYARKARLGLAQERGGRRGAGNAFANVGVAAICGVAALRHSNFIPLFMGITSLATAAADTCGTEVGQLLGKRAFLPLSFRRVPPGTEGAISLEGCLAAIGGAFVVASSGVFMFEQTMRGSFIGTIEIDRWRVIGTMIVCAFIGSYLESIAGSINVRTGKRVSGNALNFFNTATGAVLFAIAKEVVPMFGVIF